LSEQNLDFIDNLRKNQHIVLFSDDEEKSFVLQTRFLKNGLEKGEICAYLSYRDPDEIIRILTDNGLKTGIMASKQIIISKTKN
jgi:hypothetical protein